MILVRTKIPLIYLIQNYEILRFKINARDHGKACFSWTSPYFFSIYLDLFLQNLWGKAYLNLTQAEAGVFGQLFTSISSGFWGLFKGSFQDLQLECVFRWAFFSLFLSLGSWTLTHARLEYKWYVELSFVYHTSPLIRTLIIASFSFCRAGHLIFCMVDYHVVGNNKCYKIWKFY